MTSVATQNLKKNAGRPGYVEQPGPSSDGVDALLSVLIRADRPLTMREVAIMAALSPADVASTLENMCQFGVLRRLNTVIETYTARFL
jgi:hypothetical protein